MPTGARLVAALGLGFASAVMAHVLVALYPEEDWIRQRDSMARLFLVVGALIGWYSLGKRAAFEPGVGVSLGVRAAITVVVSLIFIMSIHFVINRIVANKLAGADPMDAIFLMFDKAAEYTLFLLNWQLIGAILVAGITVGVLTKHTQKLWS